MKRTPIRRKTGLKRTGPPKRVNVKRKAARNAAGKVYGRYHEWICSLPCHFHGPECKGIVKGHHVKTVGSGGEDWANEVPLCVQHHADAHSGKLPKAELAAIALEYSQRPDVPVSRP